MHNDSDDSSASVSMRWVRRLRLRHLELLDLLSREPNLTRAAAQMNLTQPTVSKLLSDIESICAATLFIRNRRGLQPTPAGSALSARAVFLLEQLRATHDELKVVLRGASRRARIGVFPVAVPDLLVNMRARLSVSHPGLVLTVEEGIEYQLIDALQEGRLDCVLGRVVLEQLPREILHEVLHDEPTVIVSGRNHPLATACESERLALLAASTWLLPAQEGAMYNMVKSRLALDHLPAPRVTFESVSVHVTVKLLENSSMLSVLPQNVARSYERAGSLKILPIKLMPHHYPVGIMFRHDVARDPLLTTLIEAARG